MDMLLRGNARSLAVTLEVARPKPSATPLVLLPGGWRSERAAEHANCEPVTWESAPVVCPITI
jgi:hypothetical protein